MLSTALTTLPNEVLADSAAAGRWVFSQTTAWISQWTISRPRRTAVRKNSPTLSGFALIHSVHLLTIRVIELARLRPAGAAALKRAITKRATAPASPAQTLN